jgi:hypothetical protein
MHEHWVGGKFKGYTPPSKLAKGSPLNFSGSKFMISPTKIFKKGSPPQFPVVLMDASITDQPFKSALNPNVQQPLKLN